VLDLGIAQQRERIRWLKKMLDGSRQQRPNRRAA
jgi:hypothetical protein